MSFPSQTGAIVVMTVTRYIHGFRVLVFIWIAIGMDLIIVRLYWATDIGLVTDPEGIANAQKSLGLGQEEKARRVR